MTAPIRILTAIVFIVLAAPALGQELEPRTFSVAPVGMNFVAATGMYLEGDILFDQATTIEDATGEVWGVGAGYVRSFGVLGASSKVTVSAANLTGDWQGTYQGAPAATSRTGFADPTIEWSVLFIGAPAMTMREMAGYRQKWVVGATVKATVPVGQYDADKLINLGTNRWAVRTRLGASRKWERFTFEAMGSIWLFQDNDDFFGGNTLEQEPLYSLQFNGIYEFPSGLWLGIGAGLSRGGQGSVNGTKSDTYKKNTRWGSVLSYPIATKHSVKLTYISNVTNRIGEDFDQISLSWSMRWGGKM